MMLAGIPPRADGVSGHRLGACAFSVTGLQKKEVRCEMKGKLVAFVGVFCIAMLIVSGASADKPPKPDKPDKPDRTTTEWIEFTGDLAGGEVVEGCCPNAGPNPQYEMTLSEEAFGGLAGTYLGYLFINAYGTGQDAEYVVQFWHSSDFSFEIIGGVTEKDRKNNVTTVTFTGEDCTTQDRTEVIATVSFVLVRTPNLPDASKRGRATPKKMNGTWSSIVTVPPNDVLGNPVDVYFPEMDTFSTSGAVITSALSFMPLMLDEGFFLASVGIGQGNWKMAGGHRFVMTQWRFLADPDSGQPFGYMKIVAEWRLVNKNFAVGEYEVHILELDMTTPFNSGGVPAVVGGPFEMTRLPIEYLP